RRHTISKRDWSSDVCSSDLRRLVQLLPGKHKRAQQAAQLLLIGVGASVDGVLPHGLAPVDGVVFLGEVADLEAVARDDAALPVRALHPGQELQQRGLTGTVEAQDADAAALVDRQAYAREAPQGAVPLGPPLGE